MDMWNYYSENAQSHICFSKKVELKEALYHMFKDVFPSMFSLYKFLWFLCLVNLF